MNVDFGFVENQPEPKIYFKHSESNSIEATRVAGPVIFTLNSSSISSLISPPGISTVILWSQAPILRATAPAAELLLPEAKV